MNQTILTGLLFLSSIFTFAQRTPKTNASAYTPSLTFSVAINYAGSVVYNPNFDLYYISRVGNAAFPLETLSSTGVPLYQTNAGMDTRGMWWNPNTMQVERNCYSSFGWSTINLNTSGYALNTYSIIFSGQLQPDAQSIGAYDYKNNSVLFYNGGANIYVYDRTTGMPIDTLVLSGTSFTNTNSNTVIYTGETGYEIGLLDYEVKKILLFDRVTGNFTGSSQLPADAVTNSVFRFSYSNFRVWLNTNNGVTAIWNSYYIWNEPLPVTLLSFTGQRKESSVLLLWHTAAEINNDHFEVERSRDGINFEKIEYPQVGTGDNSYYQLTDSKPNTGSNYYRLKQVDKDGGYKYSNTIFVKYEVITTVLVTPNPSFGRIWLSNITETQPYQIVNIAGQVITKGIYHPNKEIVLHLAKGVYTLMIQKQAIKFLLE